MIYNSEILHHRSICLKVFDTTLPGAYFLTLVTSRRDEIFGEVVNAQIHKATRWTQDAHFKDPPGVQYIEKRPDDPPILHQYPGVCKAVIGFLH